MEIIRSVVQYCVYICCTCVSIRMDIYIYIERERERISIIDNSKMNSIIEVVQMFLIPQLRDVFASSRGPARGGSKT